MKKRAYDEYKKDNDESTFEDGFNLVVPRWYSIHQFRNASTEMRDYIINWAERGRRTDISNYIKGKDWVRFTSK